MEARGRQATQEQQEALGRVIQPRDVSPKRPTITTIQQLSVLPPFDRAIFFDNEPRHLREVGRFCKNIALITVNQSANLQDIPIDSPGPLQALIGSLGPNVYIDLLWRVKAPVPIVSFDPKSGVTQDQLEELDDWLDLTSGRRVVIFDWDRTLTKFEGTSNVEDYVRMMNVDVPIVKVREDMLAFIIGGYERLRKVRETLLKIHNAGVKIIVMTNNAACGQKRFAGYVDQLVMGLPHRVICSRPFEGNKGKALLQDTAFQQICVTK
jgi:hypothetical protein